MHSLSTGLCSSLNLKTHGVLPLFLFIVVFNMYMYIVCPRVCRTLIKCPAMLQSVVLVQSYGVENNIFVEPCRLSQTGYPREKNILLTIILSTPHPPPQRRNYSHSCILLPNPPFSVNTRSPVSWQILIYGQPRYRTGPLFIIPSLT